MDRIQVAEDRYVSEEDPTYIIAEIGSNFDGSLERAKKLITDAKKVGADCAKFQSFLAPKIVSEHGFDDVGNISFQENWDEDVFEVYENAEFPRDWHKELFEFANEQGIDFMSSPYDREAVDLLDELGVSAFKIGSGEVTNPEFLQYVAEKGKPIILATGACTLAEVDEAYHALKEAGNDELILLQCVTQYPSDFENANIRAMETLRQAFDVPVGYSDHTPGSVVPLASVALGGRVIEKHFTDDKTREGPDHEFALNLKEFSEMVDQIRALETAMGSPVKKIYENEEKTKVIQRRGLFAAQDIKEGQEISGEDLVALRPELGLKPKHKQELVGKTASRDIPKGTPMKWEQI